MTRTSNGSSHSKKASGKGRGGGGVASEADMRRLGMSEDDIQRIMRERAKSAEDKAAEQAHDEAQRREQEQRQRLLREHARQVDELHEREVTARQTLALDEGAARSSLETTAATAHTRVARLDRERAMLRRAEEVKRRREAELAAYEATLQHLSADERDSLMQARAAEQQRMLETVLHEEEQRQRRAARAARRAAAAAARQRAAAEGDDDAALDVSSDDETNKGGASRGRRHDVMAKYEGLVDAITNAM